MTPAHGPVPLSGVGVGDAGERERLGGLPGVVALDAQQAAPQQERRREPGGRQRAEGLGAQPVRLGVAPPGLSEHRAQRSSRHCAIGPPTRVAQRPMASSSRAAPRQVAPLARGVEAPLGRRQTGGRAARTDPERPHPVRVVLTLGEPVGAGTDHVVRGEGRLERDRVAADLGQDERLLDSGMGRVQVAEMVADPGVLGQHPRPKRRRRAVEDGEGAFAQHPDHAVDPLVEGRLGHQRSLARQVGTADAHRQVDRADDRSGARR